MHTVSFTDAGNRLRSVLDETVEDADIAIVDGLVEDALRSPFDGIGRRRL